MTPEEWQKLDAEVKRATQRNANQVFLARQASIVKQLADQGIAVEVSTSLKKGRPPKDVN